MLDVTLARLDFFDLDRINIQTEDCYARFRKLQAERKPHITKTDNCHFHHKVPFQDCCFKTRAQSSAFPRHSIVAGISSLSRCTGLQFALDRASWPLIPLQAFL